MVIAPGPDVNISQWHDNQAEATITINPKDPTILFAASMTFLGTIAGTFDPRVDIPGVFQNYIPGILGSYSTDSGATWQSREMLTGGPTEAFAADRSLPAGSADPRATFDEYGNLFLTYLSGWHQFGKATGGGADALTDTSREWARNMWKDKIVIINPGMNQVARRILSNEANQLKIDGNWPAPAADTPYYIARARFRPGRTMLRRATP